MSVKDSVYVFPVCGALSLTPSATEVVTSLAVVVAVSRRSLRVAAMVSAALFKVPASGRLFCCFVCDGLLDSFEDAGFSGKRNVRICA
ncbi:hypothetical protein E6O75_ATG00206 [Venturia nashicola]|uniref:Uncharacterized protein n=1 Tax=Venturia nashicola TaxID=86259 RepID=A0A4Z1PMN0_9PEZI|nr:hypothetical protein E6O75_ATG00206 [Venturia nashicola]